MWNLDENEQLSTSDNCVEFYLSLISCNLKMQIEDIYSFPKDVQRQVCLAYFRTKEGSAPLTHL